MPWSTTPPTPPPTPPPESLPQLYPPPTTTFHELLLIGAGPSSLAIAARLREPFPSALFTEAERARYHWIRRCGTYKNGKLHPSSKKHVCEQQRENDLLVLDATSDQWLGKWDGLFEAYGIDFLRSPMFFHPCPSDVDALRGFAVRMGREEELWEIPGVVGREMSKHKLKKKWKSGLGSRKARGPVEINERERKDYKNPSTALFKDFTRELIARYNLHSTVHKATVTSIRYGNLHLPSYTGPGVLVSTSTGAVFASRAAVFAPGPGGIPQPAFPLSLPHPGSCHTQALLSQPMLTGALASRVAAQQPTTVVVIGGGLTAAQVVHCALQKGVDKAVLIMRGAVKIKHFDAELPWVGKYKNHEKAGFWSAENDDERLEMLLKARGGGSINPRYKLILDKHVKAGRLTILTHTTVASAAWDAPSALWEVSLSTPSSPSSLSNISYIYHATGTTPSLTSLPALQHLLKDFPIPTKGGHPCLTDMLEWRADVPVFVAGRLAGLRVGPWAGNLDGARNAAERIADRIEELREGVWPGVWKREGRAEWSGRGGGNCFEVLGEGEG